VALVKRTSDTATAVLVVLNTPTSRSFIVREAMANREAIARRLVPTTVERPAIELRAITGSLR
jgi:hypothetical protein